MKADLSEKYCTDYLVIGAGASGLAFVDTLVSESDATVIIIDNRHKPGGHWVDSYSFVTLHQPSSFYGVNSKELSNGRIDDAGLNQGLNELATGAEVQAYYDNVMRDTLLPSGRVKYFPLCEYLGNGRVKHLITGHEFSVQYKQKLVDSTYYKTSISATHTPQFEIDSSLTMIPPNTLPSTLSKANHGFKHFTLLGGGKTAIDTCLWLLQNQVAPENISWYMPRDAWFLDRKNTQPTADFFTDSIGAQAAQLESLAESTSIEDLFLRLEKSGVLLRLDGNIMPRMFHGATISKAELAQIKRVKHIIRRGRITKLTPSEVICTQGTETPIANSLYIDCTASAITNLAIEPVFQGDNIKLQTVRAYQPTFSAAFIAHLEITYPDNEKKNQLSKVVPLPNTVEDWIEMTYRNMMNQFFWSKEPGLKEWMLKQRLDGFAKLVSEVRFYQLDKLKVLNRMRKAAKPAIAKLKVYRELIASSTN
ncbi:NAD(P)-binding protein [Aliiglaciecola sp. LCG003]|uniref:NAD(P)-binding protein n=1 Tax=Aliiglaciecola sp. LCG003 TaxID=3053655 RepID=UPI0025739AE8|nr:NAD(P)-binding protein [Aliiglaciecola sp. LCG003]WJG07803.1 NAD(P)-binding protein [Aliiglaciecola sp. LCG003]